MGRPRVLVIHPTLKGDGGADQVAAWTLEALRRDYELTLLTAALVDFGAVDAFCETALTDARIANRVAFPRLQRLLDRVPLRLALVRIALVLREARRLDRRDRFDCIVSTFNEMDFGRPGIQYVHYPWGLLPRPAPERRWYTDLPGMMFLYHWAIRRLGGLSVARIRANQTWANSRFVADLTEAFLNAPCGVLHPPVPGRFDPLPWSERLQEVVCIGRISPEKRVDEVIDILRRVRERGHPLALRIVGLPETPAYVRELQDRISDCADWVEIETVVSRKRLLEVIHRARYGIHAMHEEHFGIAVAEMMRAGCVVFAHASGGPPEILGGLEPLLFEDADDAVDKIDALLTGERALSEVRAALTARADFFSAEHFSSAIREVVARYITECGRG